MGRFERISLFFAPSILFVHPRLFLPFGRDKPISPTLALKVRALLLSDLALVIPNRDILKKRKSMSQNEDGTDSPSPTARFCADTISFLDNLTAQLISFGAKHILITGLPLPGKDLTDLILRQNWITEEDEERVSSIKGSDILLRKIASLTSPRHWDLTEGQNRWIHQSTLIHLLKRSGCPGSDFEDMIGLHLHQFDRVQLAVCAVGEKLDISDRDLFTVFCNAQVALRELPSLASLAASRPGELSSRERHVLTLTAEGKTASHIASELRISQRTVHAHLQNASDKMLASNKTQTVVEAVRYGQIELG